MSASSPAIPGRQTGTALVGTTLHAVFISALLAFCVWRVPAVAQALNEFGVVLPMVSRCVIAFAAYLADNWRVITPVLPLLPVIDFALIQAIGWRSRSLQLAWVWYVALLLLVLGFFAIVGIELPMLKLQDQLAQ